ncbi:MAG: hypothetical protein HC875_01610 [Anaerolineales bacterium]|nr:hypothetical protein [Anaerolineales bacterium]
MSANKSTKRWLFIAWAPYSRRSETFAQAFGAVVYLIHYLKFQTPLYAPLKYILQSGRTWLVLWRERPTVVFVQNPPFVAGLVVHLYCRLTGSQYVLDHHTAAFASTWKWAKPIQQFLARRAAVNIVTNLHWAEIIQSWQALPLVMKDPFVPLPECEPLEVEPNFFNLIVINTFAPDEPLDAVLTAAAQLPSVKFILPVIPSASQPLSLPICQLMLFLPAFCQTTNTWVSSGQ